ncbi:TetR/AcrR family transcriptional regulator [Skermania piniformis]|uniref:TetR family transcriptional regulator n=1 Tax=Skermania pinensis TaxID=39122 RepID=A0ABX8S8S3_9ACTN|nr:TetR family transcriptional regulator [Skermania piniformis]QXQ13572.1 TetR family transcriptional regulator [Skermania piniformis]
MADAARRAGRKTRANGEDSREKILDAAAEIAAMRGYEGTSIGAVSKASGLPPSSIYWHFADKGDLLAAVIERSYGRWIAAVAAPVTVTDGTYAHVMAAQVLKSLQAAPDFLRLGLMLVLERRPDEPEARKMFVQVRDNARAFASENLRRHYPQLDERQVKQLAAFVMSAADGLFIASEAAGDQIDLVAQFDLIASAVDALVAQFAAAHEARAED